MDKILGIVFLFATILVGLISNGKIELDKVWLFANTATGANCELAGLY